MREPTIGELQRIYKDPEDELDLIRTCGVLLFGRPLSWLEFAEFILRRTLRQRFSHPDGIRRWIPEMVARLQDIAPPRPNVVRTFNIALYNDSWLWWPGGNYYAHVLGGDRVRHLGSTDILDCHIIHFAAYWREALENLGKFRETQDEPTARLSEVDEAYQQVRRHASSAPVEGQLPDHPGRGSV